MSPVAVALLLHAAPEVAITGDAGCLERGALLARVQQWSESTSLPDDAAITIEHDAARLHVRVVRTDGRAMERAFAPPPASCSDAELVAAVAVALALDATSAPAPAPSPATPPPLPQTPADATDAESPPMLAARRSQPAPIEPAKPVFSLGLGLGASVGVVPTASFEDALGLRVLGRRLAMFVELASSQRRAAPLADGVVDIVRFAAATGVCAHVGEGRVAMGLCAGISAGGLWGRARRIRNPGRAVAPWLSALARADIEVALDRRWSLAIVSDAVFGILRPRIVATGAMPTGRVELPTPRVGWRGLVEVRVRWGGRPARPRASASRAGLRRDLGGS